MALYLVLVPRRTDPIITEPCNQKRFRAQVEGIVKRHEEEGKTPGRFALSTVVEAESEEEALAVAKSWRDILVQEGVWP